MLASFLCVVFLLHIPCCFFVCFCFIWGVSLTHPVLALFFFGEFLLHIPWWLLLFVFLLFFSFSSSSCGEFLLSPASFICIWGVSLTHPMLALFFCGEFLLHVPCWFLFFKFGEFLLHIPCWSYLYLGSFSYTSRIGFIFMWGVSLTHPLLASFFYLETEFLLHIPCWLHFYLCSFSYTSHAGFFFFFLFF